MAAAPASAREDAAARAENAAATRAYLTATNSFEETELTDLPQEIAATETVVAGISAQCLGVLANAPPHEEVFGFGLVGSPSQPAPSARAEGERRRQAQQLGDLKLELSLALADSRTPAGREAALALVRALTPLKWSNPKITFLLHLTVEEIHEELDIPTLPVCADMKAWVASGYKTLASASKELASRSETLLKRTFELLALVTQLHIQPFPKVLAPYENAADRALARHTEALTAQLKRGSETDDDVLKRLEATVGLPAPKARKVEPPKRKPVVVAHGMTAAGGSFVVRAERLSGRLSRVACTVDITIEEPSRPHEGISELLGGEGTSRCPSRSHIEPEPAVQCDRGLLVVEANLPPATRSVRLLLSDHRTITSSAIRVPARLGGPVGLYYQVVRGPSPIPVSLTELDAQDNTLAVLKLPAVVECTKHPVKYFPGGRVRLVHESLPQGPSFTIRAERYRKLGAVHFELKFEASNEELHFGGGGEGGSIGGAIAIPNGSQTFEPQASSGCQPQPYAIIYGLLKDPGDTVLARVSGALVPLHQVVIPAHLHADGVLVYGAFSPLPTELLVRNASGKTVDRKYFGEAATSDTETCEGEAE